MRISRSYLRKGINCFDYDYVSEDGSYVKITQEAIQIVGGLGYSEEYPLERYYRDAKVAQIAAGSTEIRLWALAPLTVPCSPPPKAA